MSLDHRTQGDVPSSVGSNGIEVFIKKDPQAAMTITLAYMTKLVDGKNDVEYRRSCSTPRRHATYP